MTAGKYRVVVWATGGIGSIAIRAIQQRPRSRPRRGVGALPRKGRHGRRRTRQWRPDRAGRHHRRGCAHRAQTRLRHLRRQRARARRAGDPRLRETAQRRNQRRDDEHHATGQSACVRARRVARSAGDRGEGRARRRSTPRASNPASPPIIFHWCCPRSRHRSRRSTLTRSVCTTTTACPTS